jgi:hypothetical protein
VVIKELAATLTVLLERIVYSQQLHRLAADVEPQITQQYQRPRAVQVVVVVGLQKLQLQATHHQQARHKEIQAVMRKLQLSLRAAAVAVQLLRVQQVHLLQT